ncbi:hypothetical protein GGS23DRAFT_83962 [Durotheca rogersii]|uniref:uncharacterized protein n=1 Tax=Durotheca rogersii TaxID=419775 RepID=UPI00221F23EE|nr:uncharacterized protein GGS23DRAFT_83962 [Durotheca rogersii]KAI5862602.1 hypothetical protein GGS23DRAFT_83962 [Durotheca rogersii]
MYMYAYAPPADGNPVSRGCFDKRSHSHDDFAPTFLPEKSRFLLYRVVVTATSWTSWGWFGFRAFSLYPSISLSPCLSFSLPRPVPPITTPKPPVHAVYPGCWRKIDARETKVLIGRRRRLGIIEVCIYYVAEKTDPSTASTPRPAHIECFLNPTQFFLDLLRTERRNIYQKNAVLTLARKQTSCSIRAFRSMRVALGLRRSHDRIWCRTAPATWYCNAF